MATAVPVAVPQPVAMPRPVATTATTPQPAKGAVGGIVVFEEAQEEPESRRPQQGNATPRPMPGQPVPTTMVPAQPTSGLLNPATLKKRFEAVCGKLAHNIVVTQGANQDLTVQILVPNNAAEEQVTPRLLAMPELASGKIRLEIHVPQ
jgi:hypothetical protein